MWNVFSEQVIIFRNGCYWFVDDTWCVRCGSISAYVWLHSPTKVTDSAGKFSTGSSWRTKRLMHSINASSTNIQFWVNSSKSIGYLFSLRQDWVISKCNLARPRNSAPRRLIVLVTVSFFFYPYISSWLSLYLITVHFECIYKRFTTMKSIPYVHMSTQTSYLVCSEPHSGKFESASAK